VEQPRAPVHSLCPQARNVSMTGASRVLRVSSMCVVPGSRIGLAGTIVAVVGRGKDGPAKAVRVRDRQLVASEPAETEADHVGLLDPQVVEQGYHVGSKVREGRGTVDVGGATVTLELDRDDPMVLGERRHGDAEVQLDGHQTAVEEHQRRSLAVFFVVEVQPVDIRVRHVVTDSAAVANSSRVGFQVRAGVE
jgi:hypothetical protein